MLARHFFLLPFAVLLFAACAVEPEAGSDDADLEAAGFGVDCTERCAGWVNSERLGGLTGWMADVSYLQDADCRTPRFSTTPGYHATPAGETCRFLRSDGAPSGAYECEQFSCGETGTFVASACFAPHWEDFALPAPTAHCADRETACSLALEARSTTPDRTQLCR